jgi:hypothetical protein
VQGPEFPSDQRLEILELMSHVAEPYQENCSMSLYMQRSVEQFCASWCQAHRMEADELDFDG